MGNRLLARISSTQLYYPFSRPNRKIKLNIVGFTPNFTALIFFYCKYNVGYIVYQFKTEYVCKYAIIMYCMYVGYVCIWAMLYVCIYVGYVCRLFMYEGYMYSMHVLCM